MLVPRFLSISKGPQQVVSSLLFLINVLYVMELFSSKLPTRSGEGRWILAGC